MNATTCNRKLQRTGSSGDKSLLLERRLYKIAHIRRAPQKAKDPCKVASLLGGRAPARTHGDRERDRRRHSPRGRRFVMDSGRGFGIDENDASIALSCAQNRFGTPRSII